MSKHKISLFNKELFWTDDISFLYSDGRYTKFIPRYEMTRNEQLNAVSRFSFYMIFLLILFDYGQEWL